MITKDDVRFQPGLVPEITELRVKLDPATARKLLFAIGEEVSRVYWLMKEKFGDLRYFPVYGEVNEHFAYLHQKSGRCIALDIPNNEVIIELSNEPEGLDKLDYTHPHYREAGPHLWLRAVQPLKAALKGELP